MSDQHELKITPVSELRKYSEGVVVSLPPFGDDQPFVARLRRPSLMALAMTGKIPNELLNTAAGMFGGKQNAEQANTATLKQLYDVIAVMCEASFVEPKYSELVEAGVELTDEQMVAVFNFTQQGVKALEPFRKQQ